MEVDHVAEMHSQVLVRKGVAGEFLLVQLEQTHEVRSGTDDAVHLRVVKEAGAVTKVFLVEVNQKADA